MWRRLRLLKNSKPKSVKDVRSFHSLATFFRRFVKKFSTLAALLTKLSKQSVEFRWEEA